MKTLRHSLLAFAILAVCCAAQAQVSITTTGTYTQSFDSLLNTGSATWTDNSTIANWYAQRTGTGTTIDASAGTSTGGLYSFGTSTNTDRALGSVGSGGATAGSFAWGVQFQNNSGDTLTLGTLSYVGEQWRNSAAAAQTVTIWYKTSSSSITNYGAGNDTGWTALTALNFTSPITGGTSGALDGNAVANRTSLSSNLSSITLSSGLFLAIRFSDIDHTGNDHSLATDDFSLSYTAVPEPATYAAILGVVALVGVMIRRRRMQRAV